jgi:predicted metal-dependent hydrolase
VVIDAFVLTIPPRTSESHIKRFLAQCTPWVESQLKVLKSVAQWEPGQEVILQGESFQCVSDPLRRKPALCENAGKLYLPPRYTQQDLHRFLKQHAAKILTPHVDEAARALGQQVARLSFRDQRSRWGSCSGNKTISLSWRLLFAPPEVAHYVCVHEVAHLLHMNHSPAFWKVVARLCPNYKVHRKWLRTNGGYLMRAV